MEQYGQVVDLTGEQKALVKVRQHLSCENCGRCGAGTFFGDPGKRRLENLVEVLNPIGAGKGQLVRLEAKPSELLLAAFLLYIVPLMGLLAGLFAGRHVAIIQGLSGSPDLWGAGIGVVVMVSIFLVLRAKDGQFSRGNRFKAVITAVVDKSEIPEHARLDEDKNDNDDCS